MTINQKVAALQMSLDLVRKEIAGLLVEFKVPKIWWRRFRVGENLSIPASKVVRSQPTSQRRFNNRSYSA